MFTATWPRDVQSLAGDFLTNPVQINIGDQDSLNANKAITQHIMIMREFEKEDRLSELLMSKVAAKAPVPGRTSLRVDKTIIFVSRKMSCDEVAFELKKAGFSCGTLHGDKSQAVRSEVMEKFRQGRLDVLVATDVAARGLDVKDIMNVINYDFPEGQNAVENYVHRIGRTARGSSSGDAYTFLTNKNMVYPSTMKELVGVLRRCEQEVPAELEVPCYGTTCIYLSIYGAPTLSHSLSTSHSHSVYQYLYLHLSLQSAAKSASGRQAMQRKSYNGGKMRCCCSVWILSIVIARYPSNHPTNYPSSKLMMDG